MAKPINPNSQKIEPRRSTNPSQGNENVELTKNEISKLTALSGLMSVFLFGTDAADLFNEETNKTAMQAKSMKQKAGKGLFPTLKEISEKIIEQQKPEYEPNKNLKKISETFTNYFERYKMFTNDGQMTLFDISSDIQNVAEEIKNIKFAKSESEVSKLLIEINGNTNLSDLISSLQALSNDDIASEQIGIISKLENIIKSVKETVSQALDIDVKGAISNVSDLHAYIQKIQAIIATITSMKLSEQSIDDMSNFASIKLPQILQIDSDEYIGKFIEQIQLVKQEFEKLNVDKFSGDLTYIQKVVQNIVESVNEYNKNVAASDISLNRLVWRKLPDQFNEESKELFLGNYVESLNVSINKILEKDIKGTSELLKNISDNLTLLKTTIDTYNKIVGKGDEADLSLYTLTFNSDNLKTLTETINKLYGFIEEYNKAVKSIDSSSLEQFSSHLLELSSIKDKLSTVEQAIKDINAIKIDEIKPEIHISENINDTIEGLSKVVLFIQNFNKYVKDINPVSLELFDENIKSLSGIQSQLISLNNAITNLNKIELVPISVKIDIQNDILDIINDISKLIEFVIKLDSEVDTVDEKTIQSFTNKISTLSLLSKLYSDFNDRLKELKNIRFVQFTVDNLINKDLPQNIKDLILFIQEITKNISISKFLLNEFGEKTELFNTLSNIYSKQLNPSLRLLNRIKLVELDNISNLTSDQFIQNIQELLNFVANVSDIVINKKQIDKLIDISDIIANLSNKYDSLAKSIKLINDISIPELIVSNIIPGDLEHQLQEFINEVNKLNGTITDKTADDVKKFITNLQKIQVLLEDFDSINIPDLQFNKFINDLYVISTTKFEPESIEWLIPIIKKLRIANDEIQTLDFSSFKDFGEMLSKMANAFKIFETIDFAIVNANIQKMNIDPNALPKVELFENINKIFSSINGISVPSEKSITNITDQFEKSKSSIKGLFDTLVEFISDIKSNEKTLESSQQKSSIIKDAIGAIVDISNIKEIPNVKALKIIKNIVQKDGLLKIILDNIIENFSEQITATTERNIKLVQGLFDSITSLGDIGVRKSLSMKYSIWFIKNFITKDVVSILTYIHKSGDKINKEIKGGLFKPFTELIEAIVKLSELDDKSKRKMYMNVKFIRIFLLNTVIDIIKSIEDSLKTVNDEKNKVEQLKTFIESIPAIADFSLKKYLVYSWKIMLLRKFIKNEVQPLITSISELEFTEKAEEQMQLFKNMLEAMNDAFESLPGVKSLLVSSAKLLLLSTTVIPLTYFTSWMMIKLIELTKGVQPNDLINIGVLISKYNNTISKFDEYDYINTLKYIIGAIATLDQLNIFIKKIKKSILNVSEIDSKDIDTFSENITTIVNTLIDAHFDKLSDSLKNLDNIESQAKSLDSFIVCIRNIGLLERLKLITAAEKAGSKLENIVNGIIKGIEKFEDIDEKTIKKAENTLYSVQKLILTSAFVLLAGAFFASFIDPMSLLLFTGMLSGFIFAITGTLLATSKLLSDASKTIDSVANLVVKSGLILLFGALMTEWIKPKSLLLFTGMLSLFMFSVLGAYAWASKLLKSSLENANDFAYLVLVSGAVLALGSLITSVVSFGDIFAFVLNLSFMIGGTLGAYALANMVMKDDQFKDSIDSIVSLIAVSGLILTLGSVVSHFVTLGDIMSFVLGLSTLILGVLGAYVLASQLNNLISKWTNSTDVIQIGYDFIDLVLVSSAALMLGAIVTKIVGIAEIITFTKSLGLFIGGTLLVYAIAGSILNGADIKETVREFTYIILASGAVLLIGSIISKIIGIDTVISFTTTLGLFIGGTLIVYGLASLMIKGADIAETVREFTYIIIASGVMLVLGSLIASKIGIEPVIAFTACLGLFVGGTLLIYGIASMIMKGADISKTVRELTYIVIASGVMLVLGGLIAAKIGWQPIALFAGILSLFVFSLLGIYWLADKMFNLNKSLKISVEFGALVVLSSVALFIGALAMERLGGPGEAFLKLGSYALILGLFIFGIVGIYALFGKRIETSIPAAVAMGVLTVLSSFSLILGIMVMDKYPNGADKIWSYTFAVLTLVGGMSAIAYLLGKVDKKTLITGTIALGIMIGLSYLSSLVIGNIAEIADKYDLNKVWLAIGQMGVIIGGLTSIALILGGIAMTGIGAAVILAGVGLMASIVCVALLAAQAMQSIAKAIKAMSEVPDFDPSNIISGIQAFVSIAEEMKPISDNAPAIIKASIALSSLRIVISSIAEAVQEYAELKVPVYEGTKVVRYRQLKKSDFKHAADNVKIIVTTLGGAVISVYEKKPEIFETNLFGNSPFAKVCKSLGKLGPMLSKIAIAVKNYASLKVPEEWDKEGNPKGYRELKKDDFKNAADNVKLIIETLGGAIVDVYSKHPDYYETSGGILGFGGSSPFGKTVDANMKLAKLITRIAGAVKDYANLKAPIGYNADGTAKGWVELKSDNFKAAADNVKLIIETLGGAIIDVYEAHPDYYETTGGLLGFGGSSPFGKTIDANIKLAKLITRIAEAVKDYANLKAPTGYDAEGKAKGWVELKKDHFKAAADNVTLIITTLGGAIIDVYQKHPDYYEKSGGFLGFGGSSPFAKTIEANMMLAKLISRIADSVKDYANMKAPTGYDAEGKATGWTELKDKHFKDAAENVKTIILTLGDAVMKSGEEMDKRFSPKKFKKIVQAQTTLGDLISKISNAVLGYATGKVPTGYDKDGKAIGYEPLGPKHFKSASQTIQDIIKTLGQSIITTYDKYPEYFKKGKKSKFGMASEAIGTMGTMILNIAQGIQGYADLKMPKYNKDGEIVGYEPITNTVFVKAGENISTLVNKLGKSIIDTYEENPSYFKKGPDSKFGKACAAIAIMGEMISSIAEGLQSYAELKFATKWDAEGNPIEFRQLKNTDFANAANNISTVIKTIGQAVINTFDSKPEWFETSKDNPDGKFAKVMEGCSMMGEVISNIAEGIQMYATLNVPTGWDENGKPTGFTKMPDTVFGDAAKNIGKIITALGSAINAQFYAHQNWFNVPPLKKKGGFLGLMTVEEPNPSDPPIIKAMKACGMMGGVISSIANGIQVFANNRVAKYDENGKIVGYEPMPDNVYGKAAKAISKVITSLGETIDEVYGKHWYLFTGDKINKALNASIKMGTAISSIAFGIQTYANMKYATDWDEKGKPIKWERLTDDDYDKASETIKKVLITISSAIAEAADNPIYESSDMGGFLSWLLTSKKPGTNKIVNMFNMVSRASIELSKVARTIRTYANLSFASAFDAEGKPVKWERLTNDDIEATATTIGIVLTTIGKSIVDVVEDHEDLFGSNFLNSPAYTAVLAIGKTAQTLNTIAQSLTMYAKSKFPLYSWKNGKLSTTYYELNDDDYANVKITVSKVLCALGYAIEQVYNEHADLFSTEPSSPVDMVSKGIDAMSKIVLTITTKVSEINKLDISELNQKLNGTEDSFRSVTNVLTGIYNLIMCGFTNTVGNGVYNRLAESSIQEPMSKMPDGIGKLADVTIKTFNEIKKLQDSYNKTGKTINIESLVAAKNLIMASASTINWIYLSLYTIVRNFDTANKGGTNIFKRDVEFKWLIKDKNNDYAIITSLKKLLIITSDVFKLMRKFNSIGITVASQKIPQSLTLFRNFIDQILDVLVKSDKSIYKTFYPNGFLSLGSSNSITNQLKSLEESLPVIHLTLITLMKGISNIVSSYNNYRIEQQIKQKIDYEGMVAFIKKAKDQLLILDKELQMKDFIKGLNKRVEDIHNAIVAIFKSIENWTDGLTSIKGDVIETQLNPLLESYKGVAAIVNEIGQTIEGTNANSSLQDSILSFTSNDKEDESTIGKINALNASIMELIEVSKEAELAGLNGYNTVSEGINTVQNAIDHISGLTTFEQHKDILDKYVKIVNSIDVERIGKMTTFVNSINLLAMKMGNLDKLTQAIAQNLTNVLEKLTQRMETAKEVIEKSEKLQDIRQEKMKKTLDQVKHIMSQKLLVEITNVSDTSELSTEDNKVTEQSPAKDSTPASPTISKPEGNSGLSVEGGAAGGAPVEGVNMGGQHNRQTSSSQNGTQLGSTDSTTMLTQIKTDVELIRNKILESTGTKFGGGTPGNKRGTKK